MAKMKTHQILIQAIFYFNQMSARALTLYSTPSYCRIGISSDVSAEILHHVRGCDTEGRLVCKR